jgi:hypothetical protein
VGFGSWAFFDQALFSRFRLSSLMASDKTKFAGTALWRSYAALIEDAAAKS